VTHSYLAEEMGVPRDRIFVLEDGDVLELTADGGEVVETVPAGHIYVDGKSRRTAGSPVLRDRRLLSRDGVLVVALALDRDTGTPIGPPHVVSQGFADEGETPELLDKVSKSVADSLDRVAGHPIDWEEVNRTVRDSVRRLVVRETGRCPVIMPVAMEV
jgi:ribonuclease J